MARVFEAMQKYGRTTAAEGDYANTFLQFYDFENEAGPDEQIRISQPETVTPDSPLMTDYAEPGIRYAGQHDLEDGCVLELDEPALTAAAAEASEPAWLDEEPLQHLWEYPEAPLSNQQFQPAGEVTVEAAAVGDAIETEVITEPSVEPQAETFEAAAAEDCEPVNELVPEPESAETPVEIEAQAEVAMIEAQAEVAMTAPAVEVETALAPAAASTALVPMTPQELMSNALPVHVRDEFRRLRSSLLLAADAQQLQVLMVCGVEPGDGGSFVARHLSLLLAEFEQINVGRFELHDQMPTGEESDVSPESYQLALRRTPLPNLREIATTQGTVTLSELLRVCDTRTMISMLKSRFDFVLIDAPAVTSNPDTALLASQVDGVILVAQQDETPCHALAAARAALQNAKANVLGVVLNRRRK